MSDVLAPPADATPLEVEKRLGRSLTSAERDMAEALIEDGWTALLYEVPSLERRAAADSRLAALAGAILLAAVTRVVRNPEGWRQVGLDDFQGTRDSALSGGVLRFTPDELARLAPRTVSLPGVYSLGLGMPYWND